MYADDINITIAAKYVTELESIINSKLKNLCQWLVGNRPSLNVAKMEYIIQLGHQLMIHNNKQISIEIDGKLLS